MNVNSIPVLIIIYHSIIFVTVEDMPTHTDIQLSEYSKWVMKIYSRGSMLVHNTLMDIGFDNTIQKMVDNVNVNTSSIKYHVTYI